MARLESIANKSRVFLGWGYGTARSRDLSTYFLIQLDDKLYLHVISLEVSFFEAVEILTARSFFFVFYPRGPQGQYI